MTNVNVDAKRLAEQGLADNEGYKIGYINSGAKAAQNDTWTVLNASEILLAWPTVDATGASEPYTLSGAVITLTSATTGACSALVIYK